MKTVLLLTASLAIGSLAVLGLVYATASAPRPQRETAPAGAITGRVLDSEGKPVAGAKVYTYRNESPMGRLPDAGTDDEGAFSFSDLTPGYYTVFAEKEEDGYPATDSVFYAAGVVDTPRVYVHDQQTASDVVVRLGRRLAKLKGQVSDAATSRPVEEAQISLCRLDRPDSCIVTSLNSEIKGAFELLAPAAPFSIEVSAPGRETWSYDRDASGEQGERPELNRGQTKELVIRLRPKKQP